MSDFYTRMKLYREKLNLSQMKLAEKVGVRRETIVRLEKGQYNPSLKLAMDIAKELDTTVEEIFIFVNGKEKEERCSSMCDVKKYERIYKEIESLQPEDTLQLVLEAETEEQRSFYELVGDFLLQKRQREVLERNLF